MAATSPAATWADELIVRDVDSGEEVVPRQARPVRPRRRLLARRQAPGHRLERPSDSHRRMPKPASSKKRSRATPTACVSVAFSPDGKQLLSGSFDKTAILWDLATAAPLQTLKGHSWWVWKARFSPDAQPHRHRQPGRQSDRVAESREQGAGSRESRLAVPSLQSPAPLHQAHRIHRPRRSRLRRRLLARWQARSPPAATTSS